MEAAVAVATVVAGMVAKEVAIVVAITKAATAEVAVAAMEAVEVVATIKVDTVEAVAATEVAADMVVAAEAATEVVDSLRRENSRRHGAVAEAEATEEVAVAATEEAIMVVEDMVEETKTAEEAVEEDTPILKGAEAGEEIPEVPSILRIIMKATRMELVPVMEVEEVLETNSTGMQIQRVHLESCNSILAASERCRSKTLRAPSISISASTLRRIKAYFRPKKVSVSLSNAGRG